MPKNVKRLYREFKPEHYDLTLTTNKESSTFSGVVIITGKKSGRPSQRFTLHNVGLKVTKVTIVHRDKHGEKELVVDRINTHTKFDELRLHVSQIMYPGSYAITLHFEGKITRPMNGLYPCFFQHDGKKDSLLATQFESHHAREVFPCIDEPEAKATFQLSLITPKDEVVISNTPVSSTQTTKNGVKTTFETTPKMSTYLLAFVIGNLGYKEAKTRDGVVIRTYATPDNVALTDFALETAVKVLEFYNDYFAIPYPLAKCDMIALPDFASGAMENWGCVTYREQCMLVDETNSTLATKQYVAMVVAHELAHQWFGNLVTMRWWTDLWLNEGFASWIEYLAVDTLFPEWKMWTQFIVDEQQTAMKLDALKHTHPVEVPVHHPDEIRSIFDTISYSKGASVIHMLHDYLGADVFRDGLRHYLNRHQHDNTDTIDLWQALEEISGKPVKNFMHAWTSQSGFPLIHADSNDHSVALSQKRFLMSPNKKVPETSWPVPLLRTHNDTEQLAKAEDSIAVSDTRDFLLNRNRGGFYRISYNVSHLKQLGEEVLQGKLSELDRLGILADLFETAKASQASTADALHFLENFRGEQSYAVWDVIASSLGSLRLVMDDDELRESMKPYTRRLVGDELERLGWKRKKDESHFDQLLRPIILGLAAAADEESVIAQSRKLFDSISHTEEVAPELRTGSSTKEVKRGIDIDPDMRGVVFGTIARHGNKADFEKLAHLHNTSVLSEERTTLTAALTGFEDPKIIQEALAMINSDNVRLQDVAYWIAYSFLNRFARASTWEWLKENWTWLEKNLGTDLSFFRTPIYVARAHSDKSFIAEYKAFFEPKLSPALERSYYQGLEMLEWQSAWKSRDLKEVKHFFKS